MLEFILQRFGNTGKTMQIQQDFSFVSGTFDQNRIRLVTHYHITEDDVSFALSFFKTTSLQTSRNSSTSGRKNIAEIVDVCC